MFWKTCSTCSSSIKDTQHAQSSIFSIVCAYQCNEFSTLQDMSMCAILCFLLEVMIQCYANMSCRQSSADLAESHVQALHKLVMGMAHWCDAYQPTGDAKLEPADQHIASHTLQQLTQLTAHLLQAMPLHQRQHLAQTLLVVSQLVPGACLEPSLHTAGCDWLPVQLGQCSCALASWKHDTADSCKRALMATRQDRLVLLTAYQVKF